MLFAPRLRKLLQLLALVLCSARAMAGEPTPDAATPPPEARSQAKSWSDHGIKAVQSQEFAVALECFERAYNIFPSPNLLFNIGVALEGVHHNERAVAAFEEFLASAPQAPAVTRDFARQRLEALSATVGRLTLVVEPAGASVHIDGVPLYASLERPIPIAPGEHTIAATLAGHRAASIVVNLSAGAAQKRLLQLERERPAAPVAARVATPAPSTPAEPARAAASPSVSALVASPSPAERTRAARLRWAGVGVLAFSLASLATGTGLAVYTAHLNDAANHPAQRPTFDANILERGNRAQALETAFFTIGGVAAATGVTLLVVAQHRGSHAR